MSKSAIDKDLLARTILLGVIAGMRAASAPSLMTERVASHPRRFRHTLFQLLTSGKFSRLGTLGMLGEMVADKLPILPDRIAPLPLLGRAFWGAFSGAAAFTEGKHSPVTGAVTAGLVAIVSAHITYRVRVHGAKILHLPDQFLALLEDAFVLTLRRAVQRTYE
ncbi:MAG TPA: hypothetical protein VJ183_03460 [Chloroflexia bacterium]|nr:hypothetical protein [Chloroflexia bacterium]